MAERPQQFTTFNHKPHGSILGGFNWNRLSRSAHPRRRSSPFEVAGRPIGEGEAWQDQKLAVFDRIRPRAACPDAAVVFKSWLGCRLAASITKAGRLRPLSNKGAAPDRRRPSPLGLTAPLGARSARSGRALAING
ncbi:hypothetical protein APY04_0587 [Hyphomicrobium sulfonivorans]|uniref:Uncharacterized protein n=1 Tax=Hyphomicrobium sulfonivorans TaxID=121290 RepID=A0A109BLW1_HYPSL|nr:hypothetical protein APY04_0587 [Hyphomicrobium sulfonivorans]